MLNRERSALGRGLRFWASVCFFVVGGWCEMLLVRVSCKWRGGGDGLSIATGFK